MFVHLKSKVDKDNASKVSGRMKRIEVGEVEGSDAIFLRWNWELKNKSLRDLFAKETGVRYVYIENDGEMWTQICDEDGSGCDDGRGIDVSELYEMLKEEVLSTSTAQQYSRSLMRM